MQLDERIRADGVLVRTFGERVDDRIRLVDEPDRPTGGAGRPDEAAGQSLVLGELSGAAIDRVMLRYARPLETPPDLRDAERLPVDGHGTLARFRFHAIVDAEARDYLVYERPGEEPIAVIATMATAALRYLAVNLARAPSET